MKDSLERFIFEGLPIRGELIKLQKSWQEVLAHKDYPDIVKHYLGQILVASGLLAAMIKIDGSLTIQANSEGDINFLMAECRHDLSLRAVAKYNAERVEQLSDVNKEHSFAQLFQQANLVITLKHKNGQQYQGLVEIKGDSIAEMLENYLLQSEQINTKLQLAVDNNYCAGLLLQQMPQETTNFAKWQEVQILANTLNDQELLEHSSEKIIKNLFNEYDIRLFEAQHVRFSCQCSVTKVSNMLFSLGEPEVRAMLKESDPIEIHCEFCGKQYGFKKNDIRQLFS